MFGWLNRRPAGCDLTPAEAQALVAEGKAVLVDVREESEWRSGHVPGAIHLPLSQFSQGVGRLPRDKKVILYCLSGGRSGRALGECAKAGLPIDSHVAGGISAWQRAGLSVVR
ncbi:MAG: rhodanese domain-containing protein [Xanthobacteraceae bacterium]|nr:MAG: rhodanese domain-containing protein [Xanthobacteraceae bacterium]